MPETLEKESPMNNSASDALDASQTSAAPARTWHAENPFMDMAIQEALNGITSGHGGPFGSVVVRDGQVIGRGHNMVLVNHDSTCHGEIAAIRDAEQHLKTHDLSGCDLYTTGEPCPMCLAACLWANIQKIYFGATIQDNASIGFRDEVFDKMLGTRRISGDFLIPLDREACLRLFQEYISRPRTLY